MSKFTNLCKIWAKQDELDVRRMRLEIIKMIKNTKDPEWRQKYSVSINATPEELKFINS